MFVYRLHFYMSAHAYKNQVVRMRADPSNLVDSKSGYTYLMCAHIELGNQTINSLNAPKPE